MFLSNKEILFFVLTFIVLFFFSKASLSMGPVLKLGNVITLLAMSFLVSLLLLLVYKYGNIAHCQADNFRFEVTPAKLCEGWPYMQSSASPELQKYCAGLMSTPEGQSQIARVSCNGSGCSGFVGRPVEFEHTPGSNDKWENERCDHISLDAPAVL